MDFKRKLTVLTMCMNLAFFCGELAHAENRKTSCPIATKNIDSTLELMLNSPTEFAHRYATGYYPKLTKGPKIGIIGDSVATGAIASPNIEATFSGLISQALIKNTFNLISYGKTNSPGRPLSDTFVDSHLLSFGQIIGHALGAGRDQIINLAEDGQRIEKMTVQLQHLMSILKDRFGRFELPELVFSSFNANNMCHPSIFEKSVEELKQEYVNQLRSSYEALSQMAPATLGTDFFVIANLDAVKVLTNQEILNKTVNISTAQRHCLDLRKPYLEINLSAKRTNDPQAISDKWANEIFEKTAKGLIGMCPAILGVDITDSKKIQHLKDIYRSYLEAQAEVASEYQPQLFKLGIRLHFIQASSEIEFLSQDVGNDCFHPNFIGQIKIAATILKSQSELFQSIQDQYQHSPEK